MSIQILLIVAILSCSQVQSFIQVPRVYRKMDEILQRYAADPNSNPVTHSLLNVLIYDKRARAFTTDRAIQSSLADIRKWNRKDAETMRQFFEQPRGVPPLSHTMKDQVTEILDRFFGQPNVDDFDTLKNIIDKDA